MRNSDCSKAANPGDHESEWGVHLLLGVSETKDLLKPKKAAGESSSGPARRGTGTPGRSNRAHSRYAHVPAPSGPVQCKSEAAAPAKLMPMDEAFWFCDQSVQRKADGGGQGVDVQAVAAKGVEGSGGPLPFLDQIQAAFGSHDVTGARAHIGGQAGAAAEAIGAKAYATGNDIAFREAPDLHTAAHEAAHVVQQRAGVHLSGGVGREGDPYERNADAVADAVVAGRSAEHLLTAGATGGGQTPAAVQRSGLKLDAQKWHISAWAIYDAGPDLYVPLPFLENEQQATMPIPHGSSGTVTFVVDARYFYPSLPRGRGATMTMTSAVDASGEGITALTLDAKVSGSDMGNGLTKGPLEDFMSFDEDTIAWDTNDKDHPLMIKLDANTYGESESFTYWLNLEKTFPNASVTLEDINMSPALPDGISIYFAKEGDETPDDGEARFLSDWAKALEPDLVELINEGGARIVCRGHASKNGKEGMNQNLSDTRADFARRRILGHSLVDDDRIVVRGSGESQAMREPENPDAMQRRVDVTVELVD